MKHDHEFLPFPCTQQFTYLIRRVIRILLTLFSCTINFCVEISRHTIVCRAAQEAGAPHHCYIKRKKINVIFAPLYLGDPLSYWIQIC